MPPRNKRNKRDNGKNTKRHSVDGRRGILLGAGILFAIAAGWLAWQAFPKAPEIRNVLLISIDTCRADRLSCYGYPSKTTPNIDAIAAQGTLFRNAYTPIPMTLPAHCSMLTGTIPPYHGIHDNAQYGFGETTLADLLKARGFYTGAIVSAMILDRRYGLDQGFDTYLDTMPATPKEKTDKERKGGDTTRMALDFLDRNREKPFFLFLHYYDPHTPYEPPEPFASQFQGKPYDGEIAFVDSCIGQVMAKMKELGLYDSTLLVITCDHGEMLGEHGEMFHMFFVYQAAVKVALVMKLPGQKQGRVVEEPVGLVDIVPTICGLLKAQPPRSIQGVDLTLRLKSGKTARANRDFYCESLTPTKLGGNSLLGLIQGNWKYIQTTRPELYDLEKDPGEETNLASSRADMAVHLQSRLKSLLEKEVRSRSGGKSTELDPAALANLAALGYVRGSVVEDFTFSQDKEDPKDLIGYQTDGNKVQNLIHFEKYAEAKRLCGKMLKEKPKLANTYNLLGTIALAEKDHAAAEGKFRKALELNPKDDKARLGLARALMVQGKRDAAIEELTKSLEINPLNAEAHNFLGQIFLEKGDRQKALAHWADSLQLDPNQPETLDLAAKALLEQGQADLALQHWESQLRLQPENAQAMSRVALLKANPRYPKLVNFPEALALARQSCELTGYKDLPCLYALATALAKSQKLQEASEIATQALKLAEEAGDTALAANIKDLLEFCKRNQLGKQNQD